MDKDGRRSGVTGKRSDTPELDALVLAEPDLVDRIFAYIMRELPALASHSDQLKAAVRAEFRGEECYIRGRPTTKRQELVSKVFALTFNGKGRRAVARELGISPATVVRMLKQPGEPERKRSSFPGLETRARVASASPDALAAGMAAMVRGASAAKD